MASLADDLKEAVTVDFETLPIQGRPLYPPAPVGVAVREPGGRQAYHAFGHLSGNTTTWERARSLLARHYGSQRPLLFHNAKFDLEVARVHLDLPLPSWDRVHDTLPLLFLDDPRAESFSLKPAAERVLGQKPEERDRVVEWLLREQPVRSVRLSGKLKGEHYAGAYVALAPPAVVGPYAVGDVDRTWRLAQHLGQRVEDRGMRAAYDRERRLTLALLELEQRGVRVSLNRLRRDVKAQETCLLTIDQWLRKRLGCQDSVNLDSNQELVRALLRARVATKKSLGTTPTGQVQTNKAALTGGVKDPQVLAVLKHRATLNTCLRTFMVPWLKTAEESGGLIFTTWHSTRTDHGSSGVVGTRTGRLSSTPNLMNIAKAFDPLFREQCDDPNLRRALPAAPFKGLLPLPRVRSYVVPYVKGHVLADRDFDGQELRLLGHFDGAEILEAYKKNPELDFHGLAQVEVNRLLGTNYPRKKIKNLGFCQLYGGGLGKIAEMVGTDVQTAKKLKETYLKAFPGLKTLYAEMKQRAAAKEPIRTWGGREYFCEPPAFVNGRLHQFDYKLVNLLIQGSAADVTKEALLRFLEHGPKDALVLLTVHDELLVSCPRESLGTTMQSLREAMLSIETEVPMLSDGAWSPHDWASLKPYKDPLRKVVANANDARS